MDANTAVVIALIVFTVALALLIGVWQRNSARRAKRRHDQSIGESSGPDAPRPFPTHPPMPSSLAGERARAAEAQRRR